MPPSLYCSQQVLMYLSSLTLKSSNNETGSATNIKWMYFIVLISVAGYTQTDRDCFLIFIYLTFHMGSRADTNQDVGYLPYCNTSLNITDHTTVGNWQVKSSYQTVFLGSRYLNWFPLTGHHPPTTFNHYTTYTYCIKWVIHIGTQTVILSLFFKLFVLTILACAYT